MTRELPESVVRIGEALATSAGGYLRNTVRQPPITCSVCATPTGGYPRCIPCRTHAESGLPIADRVASMVYAVKPSATGQRDQTYTAMFGYKGARPRPAYVDVVRSLLGLGIVGHLTCDLKLSGQRLVRWAAVPSTQHAKAEHPLHRLIVAMFKSPEFEVPLGTRPGAMKDRRLQPDNFVVAGNIQNDTHVALYDDSWVTGGSAQSAAIALHQAGAASVSILTVARVLGPEYGPNADFLRSEHWKRDFAYTLCPWTGGDCP